MNPIYKILTGALMVAVGVFSTVTFWSEMLILGKAAVGPLLILIGAFIVWLESDEWKMRRQSKESDQYQETFTVEKEQPEPEPVKEEGDDKGTTQQDVKQAVEETEGHVCGECGREFDTQRGLSIHQSQTHKE